MADGNDVARVREAIADGTLMHPAAGRDGTLLDLAQAMASLCGAPVDEPLSPAASGLRATIGEHEHYVFVLIDGLGAGTVDRMPGSFFEKHRARELTTVFPSSTAPALTTLMTAALPAAHAVTGWWVRLSRQDLTATILRFEERWSERPLGEYGIARDDVYPRPSIIGCMQRDALVLQPDYIAGSVSSNYFAGGAAQGGYARIRHALDAISRHVERASRPTYTYVYIPFVDATAHERGPYHAKTMDAAERADLRLAQLAERLRGRARLVVTADHGGIDMPKRSRRVYSSHDPLMAMLQAPPSGEPRTPVFHVRPQARESFVDRFRAELGDAFALVTPDEAAAEGLFGDAPLSDETRSRLGDFIGVALRGEALLCDPSEELAVMQGHHGGLTPEEMRIPLILA
jgi:hypothetical protein